MALIANQYTTEHAGTTSTGSLLSVDFGPSMNYVRLRNTGTLPLRFTLASSVATTGDGEIRSGETVEWRGGPTHVLGIMTTSTSTDGLDRRGVGVFASGG